MFYCLQEKGMRKIKKLAKKRNIVNRVQLTYIVIIIFICIGFIFSLYERNIVSNQYDEYASINIKLNSLSSEFLKSYDAFNSFVKTKDDNDIIKYNDSNSKITEIFREITPHMKKDKDSGIYLRILSNMLDNYRNKSFNLIRQVENSNQLDPQIYEVLKELKTADLYINNNISLLEVSYLNYSSREYESTLIKYKNAQIKIYIFLILIVIGSFSFTILISKNLNKTIGKLCSYADFLSAGRWEIPDIEEQKYYELNSLGNAFNKMKNNIRKFINELNEKAEIENNYQIEMRKSAEKDKLIKETQLIALQSQINPHFLFNTLNTISRIAMFESANNTVSLIEAASKILRYNLYYKDRLVELKDEISAIKAYITIQETRFQDQMSFIFDIDNNIDSIKLPPMLIQPVLENAIIHGLQERDKDGIINIDIKKEHNFVSIKVKDNGIGLDDEKLKNLINDQIYEKRGLGVLNVKKRLELYYGRDNLFQIKSQKSQWTEVTILIPT